MSDKIPYYQTQDFINQRNQAIADCYKEHIKNWLFGKPVKIKVQYPELLEYIHNNYQPFIFTEAGIYEFHLRFGTGNIRAGYYLIEARIEDPNLPKILLETGEFYFETELIDTLETMKNLLLPEYTFKTMLTDQELITAINNVNKIWGIYENKI